MYKKSSIDLGHIANNLRLSFALTINDENTVERREQHKVLSTFNYKGNDYIKFNPNGYINFDITRKTADSNGWNPNSSVIINKKSRYLFVRDLKIVFNICRKREDEVYQHDKDGKYHVNKLILDDVSRSLNMGGKRVFIQPVVYNNKQSGELEQDTFSEPGFLIAIKNIENYVLLTYSDILFLIDTLERVDYEIYSFKLFELVNNQEVKTEEFKPEKELVIEETQDDEIKTKNIYAKSVSEVPDLH